VIGKYLLDVAGTLRWLKANDQRHK
jgi:hypothetical protein